MGRPFPSKASWPSMARLTQFFYLPQFKLNIQINAKEQVLNLNNNSYGLNSKMTNEPAGSIDSVGSVRMR